MILRCNFILCVRVCQIHLKKNLIAYSYSNANDCDMAMAALGGWTIITQTEENNNSFVSSPCDDAVPSLNDYFEVTGDLCAPGNYD